MKAPLGISSTNITRSFSNARVRERNQSAFKNSQHRRAEMEDEVKSNELALYSRVYEDHGSGGEVNVLAIVLGLTCGCLLLSGVATTYFCKRSDFFSTLWVVCRLFF